MNHPRILVTATALVIAVVVGAFFVLNGASRPRSVTVLTAGAQPSAAPAQSQAPIVAPSASPATAPSPVAALPVGFTCGASTLSGKPAALISFISALRAGSHPGFDRFVVEFSNGAPATITIKPQSNATFVNSPRGDSVVLAGSAGLHVVVQSADLHTAYSGPTDLKPSGTSLVEVRRTEDFEGYVGFGLGLAQSSCYRASMLTSPARLVIDVQVA